MERKAKQNKTEQKKKPNNNKTRKFHRGLGLNWSDPDLEARWKLPWQPFFSPFPTTLTKMWPCNQINQLGNTDVKTWQEKPCFLQQYERPEKQSGGLEAPSQNRGSRL